MKYYVCVLVNQNKNKTYTGFTNNLNKRIKEHNTGKNKFTEKFEPWNLFYKEEY